MLELGREAPLDVRPDLGPEAEQQASVARSLQVPRGHRERERSPCERDCDVGAEFEPLGAERGLEQREERIVLALERPHRVEAETLTALRLGANALEWNFPQRG